MRKENSTFKTKFISEPGSHITNDDYFAFVELKDYACYVICDGIDDDKKRRSAEIAVSAVIDSFYSKSGMSSRLMKSYIKAAHKALLKETREFRLEASMMIIITDYRKIRYAMAGNARFYHWRNGRIIGKSADQSLSQSMAERGEISFDKIAEHEERHNLYCYLGQPGSFKPMVSRKKKLEDGDILTLCTRGIWENTGEPELLDAIEEAKEPEDVCSGIEDIILSQQSKIISNYTIAVTYVNKTYQNPKRKKQIKMIMAIAIPILMIALIAGGMMLFKRIQKNNKIKDMWEFIGDGVTDINANDMSNANKDFENAKKLNGSFTSSSDVNNKRVNTAHDFNTFYTYYAAVVNVNSEEKDYLTVYTDYCKLLNLVYGEEYIKANKLDNVEITISSIEPLSTEYLTDEEADKYEKVMAGIKAEFETVKQKAEAQYMYNTSKDLYEKATKNQKEYIEQAKKMATYNFDGTDLGDDLLQLAGMISQDPVSVDEEFCKNAQELIDSANALRYTIMAQANEELANDAYQKGNMEDAKNYLKKAKDNYSKSGSDGKQSVSDMNDAIGKVDEKKKDNEKEKSTKEVNKKLEQADTLYEGEDYDAAKKKYQALVNKCEELGLDSKITRINTALGKISNIETAVEYTSDGDDYYKAKKYEEAIEAYQDAADIYKSIGCFDSGQKANKKKLNKAMKKKDEEDKKEEEKKEKKEKEEEKKNETNTSK